MSKRLIIDDEKSMLILLRKILEKDNHEVFEACDADEGISLYNTEKPDLVITDIIMPDKEGLEIIKELKREYPDVKIVAMSGGGHIGPEDYLFLAKEFGALRTITKPFSSGEILEIVRELTFKE